MFSWHSKFIISVEEFIIKQMLIYHQMLVKLGPKFQTKIYLTGMKNHEQPWDGKRIARGGADWKEAEASNHERAQQGDCVTPRSTTD